MFRLSVAFVFILAFPCSSTAQWLLEDSQMRASRERMIGEVSTRITSSISIENILRTTVKELGLMVPDSEVVMQLEGESNGNK